MHGGDGSLITTNNNWKDNTAQRQQDIINNQLAPSNDLESAIVITLQPASYTAIIRGQSNTTGVGLVEVYDVDRASSSRLGNISGRASVQTGTNLLTGGFIAGNNIGASKVVVRAIGPSLAQSSVTNPLVDPTLELRDNNGAFVIANDNWQDDPTQAAELTDAGLAPTNPLESGIAATLPPGLYTALLAGLNNGTGIGVVEIYDRSAP